MSITELIYAACPQPTAAISPKAFLGVIWHWIRKPVFLRFRLHRPPAFSYLLTFKGTLTAADYRNAGDAQFSGKLYSEDHGFSQDAFIKNSGEFSAAGCDALLRYSAAAMTKTNEKREVLGLFPSAREKLSLVSIEALGDKSPPIPLTFFDGTTGSSEQFYK